MPSKPTKEAIQNHVWQVLAAFTNQKPNQIKADQFLQADLHFDSTSLPFLAMALRAYVNHFSDNTILVTEISDDTMTVQQLADLVVKKLA